MPGHSDHLLDEYLALGTARDPQSKRTPFPVRRLVQASCHIMFEALLFAMSSAMMALGLPLFFFLTISGWDLLGLFTHMENISARYLEAEGARRLAFSYDLRFMFAAATALVAAVRMPQFLSNLMQAHSREKAK